MKIHVYTTCWNEEKILPFFLLHYEQFADKIVVYDNMSNDHSAEIIDAHPLCERREFNTEGRFNELTLQKIRNTAWMESRETADWVIVCDSDEFIYHPNFIRYLENCKEREITVLHPHGYNMFADYTPQPGQQIWKQIKTGTPSWLYSKKAVFDPKKIKVMNFRPGSHICAPKGVVNIERDQALKLLHYKFIGGLDTVEEKWGNYGQRQSLSNRLLFLSWEFNKKDRAKKRFEKLKAEAKPIDIGA